MVYDDIDLDRVVIDPAYRRQVIERLNAAADGEARIVGPAGPSAHEGQSTRTAAQLRP